MKALMVLALSLFAASGAHAETLPAEYGCLEDAVNTAIEEKARIVETPVRRPPSEPGSPWTPVQQANNVSCIDIVNNEMAVIAAAAQFAAESTTYNRAAEAVMTRMITRACDRMERAVEGARNRVEGEIRNIYP